MSFTSTGKQGKKKADYEWHRSVSSIAIWYEETHSDRFQTSAHLYTILISKQTYLRPFNTNKDRVKAI